MRLVIILIESSMLVLIPTELPLPLAWNWSLRLPGGQESDPGHAAKVRAWLPPSKYWMIAMGR